MDSLPLRGRVRDKTIGRGEKTLTPSPSPKGRGEIVLTFGVSRGFASALQAWFLALFDTRISG